MSEEIDIVKNIKKDKVSTNIQTWKHYYRPRKSFFGRKDTLETVEDVTKASLRIIGTLSNLHFADLVSLYDKETEKIAVPVYFRPSVVVWLQEDVYTNVTEELWNEYRKDRVKLCIGDPEVHVVDKKWRISDRERDINKKLSSYYFLYKTNRRTSESAT